MSWCTEIELGPKELLTTVLQDHGFASLRKLAALVEAASILLTHTTCPSLNQGSHHREVRGKPLAIALIVNNVNNGKTKTPAESFSALQSTSTFPSICTVGWQSGSSPPPTVPKQLDKKIVSWKRFQTKFHEVATEKIHLQDFPKVAILTFTLQKLSLFTYLQH